MSVNEARTFKSSLKLFIKLFFVLFIVRINPISNKPSTLNFPDLIKTECSSMTGKSKEETTENIAFLDKTKINSTKKHENFIHTKEVSIKIKRNAFQGLLSKKNKAKSKAIVKDKNIKLIKKSPANFGKFLLIYFFIDVILSNKNTSQYHIFTLKNGIQGLIIKDDKITTDGVCITIKAGAQNDRDVLGLAHFTEHMLFLGSKKYPEPTQFVDYVSQYNGKFNGYTTLDRTAFYFKIHKDYFEKSLDIFSQFFIQPLFDSKYINKEVNSVNSEFERNCQQDSRKKEAIIKRISNPNSLMFKFRTGNTKTLLNYSKENNIDLKKRVEEYYVKFFNPKNMGIIIMGSKKINEYVDLSEKYFGTIKEKIPETYNLNKNEFMKINWELPNQPAFEIFNIRKLVFFETVNEHKEIEITFIVPDLIAQLPNNPALYFKTLINYQGQGSLLDTLRINGFISSLRSQAKFFYKGLTGFKITGYITDIGIKNVDKILLIINAYINFLKKQALKPELYKNVKEAYDKQFFTKKQLKPNLMKNLKNLSLSIDEYKKKHMFSQNKLLNEYDKDSLLEFLKYLKVENSYITIGNKTFDIKEMEYLKDIVEDFAIDQNKNIFFQSQEPYLITNYSVMRFNDNFISKVKNNSDYRSSNFGEDFNININDEDDQDDEGDIDPEENENKKEKVQDKEFLLNKQTKPIFSSKEDKIVDEIIEEIHSSKLKNTNNEVKNESKDGSKESQTKELSNEDSSKSNDNGIITQLFKTLETDKPLDNGVKKKKFDEKLCVIDKQKFTSKKVRKASLKALKHAKSVCRKKFQSEGKKLKPTLIDKTKGHLVYLKTDRSFLTTKTNLILKVILPMEIEDKEALTILRLFVFAVNLKIRNFFKDHDFGPNEILLKVNPTGFQLNLFSFASTIQKSLFVLLKGIQNIEINENEFILIKDEMQKQFDATINIIPRLKAVVNFFSIILEHYLPGKEVLMYLHNINNFQKVNEIFHSYLKNAFFIYFFHGAIEKTNALEIVEGVKGIIKYNNFDEKFNYLKTLQNNHFKIKGSYVFRESLTNSFNYDHATVNFYQIGRDSLKNLVNTHLIRLIVGYVYFTELRIKQQLGYSTSGKLFIEGKTLYFTIMVQGSKILPNIVDEKIEDVIGIMRKRIENVSKSKFKKLLKGIKSKLKLKDKSLKTRTERIWKKISLNKKEYNEKAIVKKLIRKTSKAKLLKFFDKIFTTNIGKLSIQEYSKETGSIPVQVNEVKRGKKIIKTILIKDFDYFRDLNKQKHNKLLDNKELTEIRDINKIIENK